MESQAACPTVYVVDDDPSIRATLPALLAEFGYEVVCFESAEAFLQGYEPARIGCVILDIDMAGMTGVELQAAMKARHWDAPIIFFTGKATVQEGVHVMREGASYLLEKPVESDELKRRVADAVGGHIKARAAAAERAHAHECLARLTRREREIAAMVGEGKTSIDIGDELDISVKTVHVHRANIMDKCHVENVAQLVAMLVRAENEQASGDSTGATDLP